MFFAVEKGQDNQKWNGCNIVVPTPSVGNVSQLAIDLIISTLKLPKIGYLYDDSMLPMVGNDPFAEKTSTQSCNLVTGCEVYGSQEHKLVVVQLRSQIVKDKRKQFRQMFTRWAKEADFSDVIVLSGSFAHLRIDQQLTGSQLRYLPGEALSENLKRKVEELGFIHLESAEDTDWYRRIPKNDKWKDKTRYAVPGGGGAKHLVDQCCEDGLSSICLLTFCAEGNNAVDAVRLADFLNSLLSLVPEREKTYRELSFMAEKDTSVWRIPSSWRLFYGNLPDKHIY